MDIFDKFFKKFAYKFPKGYPDMNDNHDVTLLNNIIQEILGEAKQVGILYHFTSYRSMIDIINDGLIMNPVIGSKQSSYLSFTRNKYMKSNSISQNVRIKIDGDMLSERYRIEPYADIKAGYGRHLFTDESEERINLKLLPNGVDISPSLINLDIMNISDIINHIPDDDIVEEEPPMLSSYIELLELLKVNPSIKYNIVKNFKIKKP
jgi:hypothetical protein